MAYDEYNPYRPVSAIANSVASVPGATPSTAAPMSSPPASTTKPAPSTTTPSPVSGIRAVLSGAYDDASQQFKQGNYGAGFGQALLGLSALPVAAGADVANKMADVTAPVREGAFNAISSFLGGPGATPAPGPISTAAAKAPVAATTPTTYTAGKDSQSAAGAASLVPSAPGPVAAIAAPAQQPQFGPDSDYAVVKRYLDANGKPTGQVIRVARGQNVGGVGAGQIQLPDGRNVSGTAYREAQAQDAATAANDPVARQQSFQQQWLATVQNLARSPNYADRLIALSLGRQGPQNIAGAVNEQARLTQQAPLTQAQTGHTNAQTNDASLRASQTVQTIALQQKYLKAMDEGRIDDANAIAEQLGQVAGRPQPDKYLVVPGGTEMVDGLPVNRGSRVYDTRRGSFVSEPNGGAAPAAPAVGAVMNGYRFKGGNPKDQKSWEKV